LTGSLGGLLDLPENPNPLFIAFLFNRVPRLEKYSLAAEPSYPLRDFVSLDFLIFSIMTPSTKLVLHTACVSGLYADRQQFIMS